MAGLWSKLGQVVTGFRRLLPILMVALLLYGVFLPLQLLLVIPFVILRKSVRLIARIFRPDLIEIFSDTGVFMALESVYTRPKNVILVSLICDGELCVDKLRSEFQRKVLNYRDQKGNLPYDRFRQRWTSFFGFFFWQYNEDFSLENHIRLYDYTEPDLVLPEVCTEADLQRITGPVLAKPFKRGQSPWEMLIIPSYRSADNNGVRRRQAVIVWRVHHALTDGVGLLIATLKCSGAEDGKTTVPQPNFPKVSGWQRCIGTLVQPLRLPYDFVSQLCSAYDGGNCWHLVGQKLSRKYLTFHSDAIPVAKIKDIKNRHGVSYNVAVYTIVLGGIRRLMLEAGQEVPKDKISCFIPLPLPGHPGGLRIHLSGLLAKLSLRLHSPVDRLKQVSQAFQILQKSPYFRSAASGLANLGAALPAWILRLLYNKSRVTLVMSSFPGPQQQLDVLGTAKVVEGFTAMGHFAGSLGAFAALFSLGGKQKIVLTVDQDIFQSYKIPQNFATLINDEVHALLHADSEIQIEQV